MATGTRPGYIDITSFDRAPIYFPPVYKTEDGKPPKANGDGEIPEVESYVLRLGSTDDADAAAKDDKVLGPNQSVPSWALAHLRKLPTFELYEQSGKVRVYRAA